MVREIVRTVVRVIQAGVLICGGLVIAPHAAAVPQTCPPLCDQIPATAWPSTASIPLDNVYHWPRLAQVAVAVSAPRFRFEEICLTPQQPGDPRTYAVAEKAVVGRPDGQWQLQAQVIHWRGDTSQGGQLAQSVFNSADVGLRLCQVTAPPFVVAITTDQPGRLAAVITGPGMVIHQYLVSHPENSTVSELALWYGPGTGGPPPAPWPVVADGQVFDAMSAPLCAAYLSSCG
jgi:hypothetical protein